MKRRDLLAGLALAPFAAAPAIAAPAAATIPKCLSSPPGLILVGVSCCVFCQGAASVLQAAAEPVGLPLLVASQDGRPIAPIPDCADARGHPQADGAGRVPLLLIVDMATQQVVASIEGYRNPRAYLTRLRATLLALREGAHG
ncbi:conjugal transfer protein TraF [Paracoccus sp. FO-3]|uniref:conjugal transfer protein TraF n=1 Tax=Paracoccus sp. FO-3 TaxID=1335059 RepID=UPI00112A8454|nr:conjugal transfer protein TraF [Paracoccus sp. FO-3]